MKNHQSTIYIRAIATQKIYLKSNNPGAIVEKIINLPSTSERSLHRKSI
ncbi:hypothetical protein [Okeania sp. SIO1I7]|nr:hypothetical protein [Okeania sp. SIO1I7]NET29603.1 hypothetical protein [Okeania sp. SIO1I7]